MKERLILRSSGIYVCRDTMLFCGTERDMRKETEMLVSYIEPLQGVADPVESMQLKVGKIPAGQVKGLLGTILEFPRTETLFVMYYSTIKSEWFLLPLGKHASGASVGGTADLSKVPSGYMYVGTIHTHPEMGAFWSGTDRRDQEGRDGLHVVLGLQNGHVSKHLTSLFTKFGNQFDFSLGDLFDLDGVDFADDYEADAELLAEVRRQEEERAARLQKPAGGPAEVRPFHFGGSCARYLDDIDEIHGEVNVPMYSWHNTMDGHVCNSPSEMSLSMRLADVEDELEKLAKTVKRLQSDGKGAVNAVINRLTCVDEESFGLTDDADIASREVERLEAAGLELDSILSAVLDSYQDASDMKDALKDILDREYDVAITFSDDGDNADGSAADCRGGLLDGR